MKYITKILSLLTAVLIVGCASTQPPCSEKPACSGNSTEVTVQVPEGSTRATSLVTLEEGDCMVKVTNQNGGSVAAFNFYASREPTKFIFIIPEGSEALTFTPVGNQPNDSCTVRIETLFE